MTFKQKFIIGTVGILSLFLLVSLAKGKSPEELRQEAYEKKVEVMREDCKRIASRYVTAFNGNGQKELQDSIAWFAHEYGMYPELLCTAEKPFFGRGV